MFFDVIGDKWISSNDPFSLALCLYFVVNWVGLYFGRTGHNRLGRGLIDRSISLLFRLVVLSEWSHYDLGNLANPEYMKSLCFMSRYCLN